MGNFSKIVVCAFCLFPALLHAADGTAPIIIDPTVQSYDGLFSRKLSVRFYVGEVIDMRQNAPSDTLGMTRTGRNSSAPLVTRLGPADLLKNSIQGMLRELSAFSEERASAAYVIQAEVLSLDILETSKMFSQEIRATLRFRVKIRNAANDELLKQFVITSENVRKALDTTKFAETVATNAIIVGLINLIDSLSLLK
jgi:hypothetical protein